MNENVQTTNKMNYRLVTALKVSQSTTTVNPKLTNLIGLTLARRASHLHAAYKVVAPSPW